MPGVQCSLSAMNRSMQAPVSFSAAPTAIVERGASIGPGSCIGHHAHVRSGSRIGQGCSIAKNVFVDQGVTIGDRTQVGKDVSVYAGVTLEEDVFVDVGVVFTNDRWPRVGVPDWERRSTLVRRGASVGANATVVCGIAVGRWALIEPGAVVTRPVADHEVVGGIPARWRGWACACGRVLARGSSQIQGWWCDACGREGNRQDDVVRYAP